MKTSIIAFLLSVSLNAAFSQGCSDAGFCSVNGIKPTNSDTIQHSKNEIRVGINYGQADFNITTIGAYLDYSRIINQLLSFNLKFTAINQEGNNLTNSGLSDLYFTTNYQLHKKIGLTTGVKFPLNDGNISKNGLPLPLDYQPSLGTIDYLLGVSTSIKKLQIVGAWQQPITQNENQFIAESYPENSFLRNFRSTRNFQRAGDVLLRLSYPVNINSKITFTPSILSIYHLKEDRYTATNGITKAIVGSSGLTLNANLFLDYKFNDKSSFHLNTGVPFIVRTTRPDGLTRSLVLSLEFKQQF